MKKPILEIRIDMTIQGKTIKTARGDVSMIPFGGIVKSDLFNGIVEPWGVDTQITNHIGIKTLSARYMLTGKDKEGQDCHIYVENKAWMKADEFKPSFESIPVFYTDSDALASYLHQDIFYGVGSVEEGVLWIRFYEKYEEPFRLLQYSEAAFLLCLSDSSETAICAIMKSTGTGKQYENRLVQKCDRLSGVSVQL